MRRNNKSKLTLEMLKLKNNEIDVDKRLSDDKFEAIKKINETIEQKQNIEEQKSSMIILKGNQGSGKTLVVNKVKEMHQNFNHISIDLWNLFGLRNHSDYTGDLPTSGQTISRENSLYHSSYGIIAMEGGKEKVTATKLNVRKILWKAIISSMEQSKVNNIRDIFNDNKEETLGRRKILSGVSLKTKIFFWLLSLVAFSLFIICITSLIVQWNLSITLSTLITSITIPLLTIYFEKFTYVKTTNLNNFLIDENNHDLIRKYLIEKTRKKPHIIHLENIDRLRQWLKFKEVNKTSLIEDIIMILSLIYKSGNIHFIIEIDDDTMKEIAIFNLVDYRKKIITNIISIQSITYDIFTNHIKMKNLLTEAYYEIISWRNNNLSYRLLEDHKNIVEKLAQKYNYSQDLDYFFVKSAFITSMLTINNDFFTTLVEKDDIENFEKRHMTMTNHIQNFSEFIKTAHLLNSTTTLTQKLNGSINWKWLKENMKYINFKDGLSKEKWLETMFQFTHEDKAEVDFFTDLIIKYAKSQKFKLNFSKESFALLNNKISIEDCLVDQKEIENFLMSIVGLDTDTEIRLANKLIFSNSNYHLLEKYIDHIEHDDNVLQLLKKNNIKLFEEIIQKNVFNDLLSIKTYKAIHELRNFKENEAMNYINNYILKDFNSSLDLKYRSSFEKTLHKIKETLTGSQKSQITKFLKKYNK